MTRVSPVVAKLAYSNVPPSVGYGYAVVAGLVGNLLPLECLGLDLHRSSEGSSLPRLAPSGCGSSRRAPHPRTDPSPRAWQGSSSSAVMAPGSAAPVVDPSAPLRRARASAWVGALEQLGGRWRCCRPPCSSGVGGGARCSWRGVPCAGGVADAGVGAGAGGLAFLWFLRRRAWNRSFTRRAASRASSNSGLTSDDSLGVPRGSLEVPGSCAASR